MDIGSLFIKIISQQIKDKNFKLDSHNLTEQQIDLIISLADLHDVTHFLYCALKDNSCLSEEQLNTIKQKWLLALSKNERLNYDGEQLFNLLQEKKIYHYALKGTEIKNYYLAPEMRTSTDIDILIKKEDNKLVSKLFIEKLGWLFYKSYQDETTYRTCSGEFIETHLDLADGEKRFSFLFENIFDGCESNGDNYRLKMTNEQFAIYNILHMQKHFKAGGCGLRPILDFYVIKYNMGYDQTFVKESLNKAGLLEFYLEIERLVECWFNGENLDEHLMVLQNYILLGGSYGTLQSRALLEEVEGKKKSLFVKIFPPFKDLKGSYKALEKCPLLYPIFVVVRWFSALFGKRKDKLKKEAEIKNKIDTDSANEINALFDRLKIK